jgi:predicted histone-like DNA-binding protein
MSIKVKAIERNVSFEKGQEKWAFVMLPELYSRLSEQKVVQEAALRSGIGKGALSAAYDAIGEVISSWACEGHSVAIPGLGTMRFGVRADSVENVEDVNAALINSRRVIFTPSSKIKDELAKTAISITCYDRDGNLIKKLTTDEEGEVEEPENPPTNPDNGGGGSGNTEPDDDDEGGLAG